jgi:hypothetical protein
MAPQQAPVSLATNRPSPRERLSPNRNFVSLCLESLISVWKTVRYAGFFRQTKDVRGEWRLSAGADS